MNTQVTIQGPKTDSEIVEMKDVVPNDWYIVVDYPHNQLFIGCIGIGTITYDRHHPTGIVSPEHGMFSHQDFKLKKLSKVNVTYEM